MSYLWERLPHQSRSVTTLQVRELCDGILSSVGGRTSRQGAKGIDDRIAGRTARQLRRTDSKVA